MLKYASFAITDSAALSELLTQYKQHMGAQMIVSNGIVLFPYEDGEPDNQALQVLVLKQERNKELAQLSVIKTRLIEQKYDADDAQSKLSTIIADIEAAKKDNSIPNKEVRAFVERRDVTQNFADQLSNSVLMSEAEIRRKEAAIARFNDAIEAANTAAY
jgi:hypothetical protein